MGKYIYWGILISNSIANLEKIKYSTLPTLLFLTILQFIYLNKNIVIEINIDGDALIKSIYKNNNYYNEGKYL